MTKPSKRALASFILWGLLPSLPFIIISISIDVQRYNVILMYMVLFILSGVYIKDVALKRIFMSFLLLFYVFLLLFDVTSLIQRFFGLHIPEMVAAIPNLLDLNLFDYTPYVLLGGLFLLAMLVSPVLIWKLGPVTGRDRMHACLGILALASLDLTFNHPLYAHDSVLGSLNTPVNEFESAIHKSGFDEEALFSKDRKLLIVIVEAFGMFRDPQVLDGLFGEFEDPAITGRYSIERGKIPYSGSTTSAEVRELCGVQGSYVTVEGGEVDTEACLPNKLRKHGFEIAAYHGYTQEFFDRFLWYPSIGIKNGNFIESLQVNNTTEDRCGGTFRGFCDRLIGKEIKRRIETGDDPKLYYWLTLNSHFPAERAPGYGVPVDCRKFNLSERLCVMAEYWKEVMASVAAIAKSTKAPPLDILVVGDHAPPAIRRSERDLFVEGYVPYIRLSATAGEPTRRTEHPPASASDSAPKT